MTSYPDSPFSSSRERFEVLVDKLSGDATADLEHGEVERVLEAEGRDVLRLLLQDHLLLRAEREKAAVAPVRGVDGVERTEVRSSARQLGTLFGDVGVQRLALVKRGVVGGLRPLDARLNLPEGKYSDGVARRLAWEVAQSSYDTAVANLHRSSGAAIAKRQDEELAVKLTTDFEDFYLVQPRETVSGGHLVVLSFDGCGVVMRPDGLRPETRKKAKRGRRRSTAESAGGLSAPGSTVCGRTANGWQKWRPSTTSKPFRGRLRTSCASCDNPGHISSARERRTSARGPAWSGPCRT